MRLFVLGFLGLTTVAYCHKQCCYPPRWQASVLNTFVTNFDGKPDITVNSIVLYYDATEEKLRVQHEDGVKRSVLVLFKEDAVYEFDNATCMKSSSGSWAKMVTCVPESATNSRQYKLGWNPSINVEDYSWIRNDATFTLSVTDDCIPVEYIVVRKDPLFVLQIESSQFQNFTAPIENVHVFDVPEVCKKD